jgi:AmmeMemoRadiSam system protein B
VNRYLQAAGQPKLEGEIIAIMAPHAGHIYSGPVAGYAFAALNGLAPELVAVVSPIHYPYSQALLTSAHTHYVTPLGQIQVDREAVQTLDAHLQSELGFGLAPIKNDREHSLEIELPFLAAQQARFQAAASHGPGKTIQQRKLDGIGADPGGRQVLLVAADLSIYEQDTANMLTRDAARGSWTLSASSGRREGKICLRAGCAGCGAVGCQRWVRIMFDPPHATSGDVTGDFDRVVGYGAAVVTKK